MSWITAVVVMRRRAKKKDTASWPCPWSHYASRSRATLALAGGLAEKAVAVGIGVGFVAKAGAV
ncbi:MAG: hypothetical protein K0V04_37830, partial [Deltaproteobacteria bacterium]|nr:hypothetical protein [Deltaproteobacteria bacterium]